MVIEKHGDHLYVETGIYFDKKGVFCERPYVALMAFKDGSGCKTFDEHSIFIGVLDGDDFNVSMVYHADEGNFNNVLHELVNWMKDHEQGTTIYMNVWDAFNFFPDCGCERVLW